MRTVILFGLIVIAEAAGNYSKWKTTERVHDFVIYLFIGAAFLDFIDFVNVFTSIMGRM